MPNRREHNITCESHGIDFMICDIVNKEMDLHSQLHPGCSHRMKTHNDEACHRIAERISKSVNDEKSSYEISKEVFKACRIHMQEDERRNRCKSILE